MPSSNLYDGAAGPRNRALRRDLDVARGGPARYIVGHLMAMAEARF
ncbi:MAG: hypothetical protein ABSF92_02250 [Candidatus Acidiferrales bacterium]|jgi:hypothetical protein